MLKGHNDIVLLAKDYFIFIKTGAINFPFSKALRGRQKLFHYLKRNKIQIRNVIYDYRGSASMLK